MTVIDLVEVSPRDGLQNERVTVSSADKIALIARAVAAGVRRIEVASFVSPARVPRMADAEAVCAGLPVWPGVTTIGLALNLRGAERAIASGVGEVGAVACASDGFAQANQGRTAEQTVDDAIAVVARARQAGRSAQVTISTAFGCPFDGVVPASRVADFARRLAVAHPHEIALGDTIGVATPGQVGQLIAAVRAAVPAIPLRLHFHDTRGMALANAWAGLDAGVTTFDASIGGCGGCPFAPSASGNAASEDIVAMFDGSGISTGVDAHALADTATWLEQIIERPLPGRLGKVVRFPPPKGE